MLIIIFVVLDISVFECVLSGLLLVNDLVAPTPNITNNLLYLCLRLVDLKVMCLDKCLEPFLELNPIGFGIMVDRNTITIEELEQ